MHLVTITNHESPYYLIVTEDFNFSSPLWWHDEISNVEKTFLNLLHLALTYIVSEQTHFIGNNKSCIDLIIANQPNLLDETEVHLPLDLLCHHSIISIITLINIIIRLLS